MTARRGIWVHVALLCVAGASAVYVWTRDTRATSIAAADVTVWRGRAEDVRRIEFDSARRRITLESRADAHGRWFYGVSEAKGPAAADGGAPEESRRAVFASVAAAEKLARALAPLRALRQIGVIGPERAAEFGLQEPAGTLVVTIGGEQRRLTFGALTAGAVERYARDDGTGCVYAVAGSVSADFESGEGALLERELHDYDESDLESVRLIAGKTRELWRRGPLSKRVWADPAAPDHADETASNWLAKVDRLRPIAYEAAAPAALARFVRLEYEVKGGKGVFLELAKAPSAASPGGKPDYFARSERTRLWARVSTAQAEQLEQDVASVLR